MPSQERWDSIWLNLALDMAENSTCNRAKTGAVITTPENQVLAAGYNGAPRGAFTCRERECLVMDGHCVRTIHAEMNAILQAARVGSEIKGATLYATHRPCYRCTTAIRQVGIKRVVYYNPYDTDRLRKEAEFLLELGLVQVVGPVNVAAEGAE